MPWSVKRARASGSRAFKLRSKTMPIPIRKAASERGSSSNARLKNARTHLFAVGIKFGISMRGLRALNYSSPRLIGQSYTSVWQSEHVVDEAGDSENDGAGLHLSPAAGKHFQDRVQNEPGGQAICD